jgi:hypothetical protein
MKILRETQHGAIAVAACITGAAVASTTIDPVVRVAFVGFLAFVFGFLAAITNSES